MTFSLLQCDAIDFLRSLAPGSVDLVFGSPPYAEARLYLEGGKDLGVARKTEAWVSWMVEVYKASLHACKGLVAFVVEGQTRQFRYSAGPALLMADLHRAGVCLRKPPIFHRVGIPGSGGPDWLRSDTEFIICATNGGKLPWSDNTACGHAPKWAVGGEMSYRNAKGARKNEQDGPRARAYRKNRDSFGFTNGGGRGRNTDGTAKKTKTIEHAPDGTVKGNHERNICEIANPGNKIEQTYTASQVVKLLQEHADVMSHKVGGGLMGGDAFSSSNEAPFPEKLCEFFIKSFCPPGGIVCDCFAGSGTTLAVAVREGRNAIGCDLRQSQVELSRRRIETITPTLFPGNAASNG